MEKRDERVRDIIIIKKRKLWKKKKKRKKKRSEWEKFPSEQTKAKETESGLTVEFFPTSILYNAQNLQCDRQSTLLFSIQSHYAGEVWDNWSRFPLTSFSQWKLVLNSSCWVVYCIQESSKVQMTRLFSKPTTCCSQGGSLLHFGVAQLEWDPAINRHAANSVVTVSHNCQSWLVTVAIIPTLLNLMLAEPDSIVQRSGCME